VSTQTLHELEKVTQRLAKIEATRAALAAKRDSLIRQALVTTGATTVARAAEMSTAAVYKIRDKEPAA
jgi:hypothetical protein